MKERIWTEASSDLRPQNTEVVKADVENWNFDVAKVLGFPELIAENEDGEFYHVAVGRNSDGEIVGAKILQKTKDQSLGGNQNSLNFLALRAQQIFGLKVRDEAEDR